MSSRFSIGSIDLAASNAPSSPIKARPRDGSPFRMLILGNYQGQVGTPQNQLKPVRIDLDNLNQIIASFQPTLEIPFDADGGPVTRLTFTCLEDFHPDALINQIPWFEKMLELRRRLTRSQTFHSAAQELEQLLDFPSTHSNGSVEPAQSSKAIPASESESNSDMLRRLLGNSGSSPDTTQPPLTVAQQAVEKLIHNVVGASEKSMDDPAKEAYLPRLDQTLSKRLQDILHHPSFQDLEASWRGIEFLLKRIELDELLQLHLLHCPLEALRLDLASAPSLAETRIFKAVVAPVIHDQDQSPWAFWVGQYTMDHHAQSLALLAALGELAASAGNPCFTGIKTSFNKVLLQSESSGEDSTLADWHALRELPQATHLGLVLPRVMARLPYGRKTDPVERFNFEEISGRPQVEDYLWNHGAIACACLLGSAFTQFGWDLASSLGQELDELPLHAYQEDGESKMTPCAEIWLNDLESETLIENGLMPLQSIRQRAAIRIPRIQSISRRHPALAASWA